MRIFTDNEQKILNQVVKYKDNCDFDNLKFRNLLNEIMPNSFIRWDKRGSQNDIVYVFVNKNGDINARDIFTRLVDFVYFMLELECLSFVKIIDDKSFFSSFSVLFDTSKFVKEGMSDSLKRIQDDSLIQISDYNKHEFKLSGINSNLTRLSDAVIFPLPILKDFIKSDFETLEYKKFKEEKKQNETTLMLTRKSLKQTRWSILISAIGCLAACASSIIAYRSLERLSLNKDSLLYRGELLNRQDSVQYVSTYSDSINSLKGSK